MNKNRKYGFTLVELLAVIVILAVVILIAVTAVVPRMNNAKKKAFIDEALVYMKAAKEAYVTDPSTECYNVSDMSNLVKQSKDGYTGTVYVNEKGVSINISNGTYYIASAVTPTEGDIKNSKPGDYLETCSDNSKEYSIYYDLDGGTVSSNPSKYHPNDPSITLNNPTRSGYRFVGWSGGKNLFDKNKADLGKTISSSHEGYIINLASWFVSDYIRAFSGLSYVASGDTVGKAIITYTSDKNINSYSYLSGNYSITINSDNIYYLKTNNIKSSIDIYQFEIGTTPTRYEEYLAPTTNAKINRGSTGNRLFVANWEAL